MSAPVRRARAYLNRVAEPPARALGALVAEEGPRRAAALVAAGTVPEAVAGETAARRELDRSAADLAAAAALGARLVVPEDDEWPGWPFAAFATPAVRARDGVLEPLALWVRGPARLDELGDRAVAVVGARAATGYGEHVAAEFGHGLAEHGFAVVSGAAYGIDGAAHRGALAADGTTVAVLTCGIDQVYPAGHGELLRRIAHTGAVVTEYPPGVRPAKHRFLVRNRLIAALTAGTVVVEAAARSGALNTAHLARVLGRVLLAVPGPVTSALSAGCHRLLREGGAELAGRVEEVVEAVGRIGTDLAPELAVERRPTDGLPPEALRVYEALPARAARTVAELVAESAVPLPGVRAALPVLELRGLVQRCEIGWQRARGGA